MYNLQENLGLPYLPVVMFAQPGQDYPLAGPSQVLLDGDRGMYKSRLPHPETFKSDTGRFLVLYIIIIIIVLVVYIIH